MAEPLAATLAGLATTHTAPVLHGAPGSVPALSPCSVMIGPAKTACQSVGHLASGAGKVASFVTDPLGQIAKACVTAATWLIDKLGAVVNAASQVDFTNPGFLRTYAVVFAASTFLTVLLWTIAVGKRAVRGVPIATAVGEAVGFLWLAVAASAFTPLALYLIVGLTDGLTKAIASGTGADTTHLLSGISTALSAGNLGGGSIMLILVSLLVLFAAATIWLELLIRAAMLYVGGVLGCAVYAGLVDRDLWRHVRRWAGLMLAVDLAKPVLVIVLLLASAVTANPTTGDAGGGGAFSAVLSGLAIMLLSVFTSAVIYRFVPHLGDDMAAAHHGRKQAANAGPVAALDGPVSHLRAGIATHGARTGTGTAGAGARTAGGAVVPGVGVAVAAAGVAAHAGRRASAVADHHTNPGASSNGSAGKPPPASRGSGERLGPMFARPNGAAR